MNASVTDDALQRWFTALYAPFNARDVPALLAAMAPDVIWPNGWEGGIVRGRDAVRDYWKRQWSQINPIVTPTVVKRGRRMAASQSAYIRLSVTERATP